MDLISGDGAVRVESPPYDPLISSLGNGFAKGISKADATKSERLRRTADLIRQSDSVLCNVDPPGKQSEVDRAVSWRPLTMSKRLASVRLAEFENDAASSAMDCKNLVVIRVRVLRVEEVSVDVYPTERQIWLTATLVREKENSAADWSSGASEFTLALRRLFIGGRDLLEDRDSRERERRRRIAIV